jgi:oligoribonuclease
MIGVAERPTRLLWIDLEMTGLDPETCVILEVFAKVTDFDCKELAHYEAVIAQPETALAQCNEHVIAMHTASGLFDRVRQEGRPEDEVVGELASFIRQYIPDEKVVLAGNSIHQDRRFIRQYWPSIEVLLHYRMLDVTSFKIYMQGKYGLQFEKKETHRALDDIGESIAELQFYLERLAHSTEKL